MTSGLLGWSGWAIALFTLATTHLTIVSVTIYLHRHQAHRALDLHPAVAHLMRFWLWLATATVTREWVAVHRKHHARVETAEDPHSPQVAGIGTVLLRGRELYAAAASDPETLRRFGHGTPDDWLERRVYTRHTFHGILVLLAAELALLGPIGLTVWAVQMLWIPVLAAGVINGVGHYWGYRNYETGDASTNIVPWGVLIGGEELHNNHHAFPSSAKLASKGWELDLGWLYIRALERLGLARVKKLPPRFVLDPAKRAADIDTVKAVIANRLQVMAGYGRGVIAEVIREEMARLSPAERRRLRRARRLLVRERLSGEAQARLKELLASSPTLEVAYRYKLRLQSIWEERSASYERLCEALQAWCREAEESGIRALEDFARTLPRYSTAGLT